MEVDQNGIGSVFLAGRQRVQRPTARKRTASSGTVDQAHGVYDEDVGAIWRFEQPCTFARRTGE